MYDNVYHNTNTMAKDLRFSQVSIFKLSISWKYYRPLILYLSKVLVSSFISMFSYRCTPGLYIRKYHSVLKPYK